jgi:iron complex outermembrane receptor protein
VAPAHADEPGETIVIVDTAPKASEDEAASASVITSDRTPRSAETMPDLLGGVPGVSVSRLGGVGAPALLSLRGSSWDQVAVYLDGVNLNLAAGGGVDVSTLPVGDLARVEVYRGVTPIAYGGSAIGGVLSVETRRPRHDGATLEFGAGSFGTWLGGGSASLARDDYGLYVGVHTLKTAGDFDFVDDKGTAFDPNDDETKARQNNRVHELDGVVRGGVALPGDRELSLLLLGFDRDQGLPGYPRYATMKSSLRTRRAVGSVAYTSRDELGEGSLLRAQGYGYGLEQRFTDPLSEIAIAPTDARDRTLALGGTVRASRPVAAWLQPAALLDMRRESFVPRDLLTGERGLASTRVSAVAGAEAAIRVASLGLAVIPSLRLEMSRDVAAGRGDTGGFVDMPDSLSRTLPVARVAVTESLDDDLMLRANVGRYARLPSFLELYGNNGFIIGNRELVPERGLSADAGGAFARESGPFGVTADAAAFAVLVDDLIQFQQNAYGVARARNIGKARVLGLESNAELRWHEARLYAQATLTDARDRSDSAAAADHQLPYRPRVHLTTRPELRGFAVRGAELGAYIELDFISGNYVDPANLVELPSRMLLGAGASLALDHGHVSLIASATNLTDASVSDVLAYPLPGRGFFLTVALATGTKEN